jgi:hypothetical protein
MTASAFEVVPPRVAVAVALLAPPLMMMSRPGSLQLSRTGVQASGHEEIYVKVGRDKIIDACAWYVRLRGKS